MAAPDRRHAASSEARIPTSIRASCVLAWRRPALAISRPTFRDGPLAASVPKGALHLALLLALPDRLALVALLLPARERELYLRPRPGEVDPGRHQRQAPLLGLPDQALDLVLVHQQLARPLGV